MKSLHALLKSENCIVTKRDGFSMVELCIVLSVAMMVLGFAMLNIPGFRRGASANASMYQIVDVLRNARELAMVQRRRIEVQFSNNNRAIIVRHNLAGEESETVIDVTLADDYRFIVFDLPDTPDALGKSDPVCFQDTDTISFLPDGSLVGDDNTPRSGSIFLGQAGRPETARAVTIIGPTGRVRSYRWNGAEWIQ
jgi:Tfp pilus assembly protein FimT